MWSEEDGVFRVALPNGNYKVTYHFFSDESADHETNIIANGKRVVKNLKIPAGRGAIERSYTITVTDERLTQIIYTGNGQSKRWGISGFTIERSQ